MKILSIIVIIIIYCPDIFTPSNDVILYNMAIIFGYI